MTIVDQTLRYQAGRTGFLLIHGLGGTPVELKFIARRLMGAGFTVHCCQLAGHCGSEDELAASTWQDWRASVARAFDDMSKICDHVHVGGLSMGAILALDLAAERGSDVAGLALLAPTIWYDGWAMPWYRFLLRILIDTPIGRRFRFVENEPYGIKDERVRARILRAMQAGNSGEGGSLGTPSAAVKQFWRLLAALKPRLGEIKNPALIVQSREDDISSLRNSFHLQRSLGGLVEALVLDDSYHIVTLDKQRDLVADRMIAFAHANSFRTTWEEESVVRFSTAAE